MNGYKKTYHQRINKLISNLTFSTPICSLPQKEKSTHAFLTEYNFILFLSLPFFPVCKVFKKSLNFYGHLALGLGSNVYQLHDPRKLRSKFLVSRMPIRSWLFEDGRWYECDISSPSYRHVHLYEKAEVKRTVVFYAALKGFPLAKQKCYENYFEKLESDFQTGHYHFSLLRNNCSKAINNIFYKEGWIKRGPFDFLPSISFKRLVVSWQNKDYEFATGYFAQNHPPSFKEDILNLVES